MPVSIKRIKYRDTDTKISTLGIVQDWICFTAGYRRCKSNLPGVRKRVLSFGEGPECFYQENTACNCRWYNRAIRMRKIKKTSNDRVFLFCDICTHDISLNKMVVFRIFC